MKTILLLRPPKTDIKPHLKNKYIFVEEYIDNELSPFTQSDQILKRLKQKKIKLDGIVSFLDFPAIVGSILAEKLKLSGPSTLSLYKAQNKAVFLNVIKKCGLPQAKWSVVSIDDLSTSITIRERSFLRPIRGSFSVNSYILNDDEGLHRTVEKIRTNGKELEKGYQVFIRHFDADFARPQDWYIFQKYVKARQFTVDGFVFRGKPYIIGIIKSIYTPDHKSFKRFDCPSYLSDKLAAQLDYTLHKLFKELDFGNSGFNMEFFITSKNEIMPIELNTRISPGFSNLYAQIYSCSTYEMMVDLAQGKMPDMSKHAKTHSSSSFPVRMKHNALVESLPSPVELKKLAQKHNAIEIDLYVKKGKKLSDYRQDEYSYRYAIVDMRGRNPQEICKNFSSLMKEFKIGLRIL